MRTFSKEEKKHILIIYRKLKETLFPLIISKINEKPGPRKKNSKCFYHWTRKKILRKDASVRLDYPLPVFKI